MTSHSSEESEGDLYESSESFIKYEETEAKSYRRDGDALSDKPISGLWTIPSDGYTVQRSTFNDKFANFIEVIISFFTKPVALFKIFIYNKKYDKTNHERIKNVKKQDNTKSKENKDTNTKKRFSFNWAGIGRGIIGLGLLISVASMIFAGIVIFMGTGKDVLPKALVVPMMLHAAIILVKQFTTRGDK